MTPCLSPSRNGCRYPVPTPRLGPGRDTVTPRRTFDVPKDKEGVSGCRHPFPTREAPPPESPGLSSQRPGSQVHPRAVDRSGTDPRSSRSPGRYRPRPERGPDETETLPKVQETDTKTGSARGRVTERPEPQPRQCRPQWPGEGVGEGGPTNPDSQEPSPKVPEGQERHRCGARTWRRARRVEAQTPDHGRRETDLPRGPQGHSVACQDVVPQSGCDLGGRGDPRARGRQECPSRQRSAGGIGRKHTNEETSFSSRVLTGTTDTDRQNSEDYQHSQTRDGSPGTTHKWARTQKQ